MLVINRVVLIPIDDRSQIWHLKDEGTLRMQERLHTGTNILEIIDVAKHVASDNQMSLPGEPGLRLPGSMDGFEQVAQRLHDTGSSSPRRPALAP